MTYSKTVKNLGESLKKGSTILIGLSGGPDSVYLAHILKKVQKKLKLTLIAVHLNHGTRISSEKDEKFCKKLAKNLGIDFETKKVNLKNANEEAGRLERYAFFEKIKKQHKAKYIALGHHLNDSIETVLLNLTRGCSLNGLTGITNRDDIIRPLQNMKKEDILSYLKLHKIKYITDPTNKKNNYSRNKIRNKVIPTLKEINPNLEKTFAKNLQNFTAIYAYIEQLSQDWLTKNMKEKTLNISAFKKLNNVLQNEILIQIHKKFTGSTLNLTQENLKTAKKIILNNKTNKKGEIGQLKFTTAYGQCLFKLTNNDAKPEIYSLGLKTLKNNNGIKRKIKNEKTIYLNKDKFGEKFNKKLLKLKNWEPGDKFQPLGLKGKKKLQDFFTDRKIPQKKRHEIPLVIYKEEILAVGTLEISEKFKITPETKKILQITLALKSTKS